ncbi:alpha/beta hydrolase [Streptomyces sp. NPDC048384]|uniref:alpha/beta fold hydrolase n=1 Tax=Streptomyces sp. NPDC048384 TaxID=3155487 RepID=UPI00343FA5A1
MSLPVRLLWGREDRILPPKYAEWLHQRIPHAELHWIEGAGHLLQEDAPGSFRLISPPGSPQTGEEGRRNGSRDGNHCGPGRRVVRLPSTRARAAGPDRSRGGCRSGYARTGAGLGHPDVDGQALRGLGDPPHASPPTRCSGHATPSS